MDEIEAKYDQLNDIAGKFTSRADTIQTMVDRLKSSFGQLEGGGWIGRGSDAFCNEMNSEIFPACQRLIDILQESGSCTRAIAERFQRAEDEASNLFRSID